MTLQTIQLQPLPSQEVTTTLSGLATRIVLRTLRTEPARLFADLFVTGADGTAYAVCGIICQDRVNLNRYPALSGLTGSLFFADTQGTQDPEHSGLGSRYILFWDDVA